ncbi:hypothetical protein [Dactylosporangium sp. NPDC051484]|uniref:hypothetical protein n=1 Tax=Dactylosporangium sp. NPDC051484 TaxID=3154942 RepID=UPI003451117F
MSTKRTGPPRPGGRSSAKLAPEPPVPPDSAIAPDLSESPASGGPSGSGASPERGATTGSAEPGAGGESARRSGPDATSDASAGPGALGEAPERGAAGIAGGGSAQQGAPGVTDGGLVGWVAGGGADSRASGEPGKSDVSNLPPATSEGASTDASAGSGGGRRELPPEWAHRLDVVITVAGLIVATLLAAALAIIEALYSPLRIGGVRVPVSLLMALVTNPLLGWFAYVTTGRRFAAILPAAAWCVIWFRAADRTSEGDMIITNDNWVGLLTLIVGPLAFAIGIYVSAMRQRTAPRRPSDPASGSSSSSSSRPAGS